MAGIAALLRFGYIYIYVYIRLIDHRSGVEVKDRSSEYCRSASEDKVDLSRTRTKWCHLVSPGQCERSFLTASLDDGPSESIPCRMVGGWCSAAPDCIQNKALKFFLHSLEDAVQGRVESGALVVGESHVPVQQV